MDTKSRIAAAIAAGALAVARLATGQDAASAGEGSAPDASLQAQYASGIAAGARPADVHMSLERTGCFGDCPSYTVTVSGEGDVDFNGEGAVVGHGHFHWRIPAADAQALLDLYARADFFHLKDRYAIDATDLPSYITSLKVGPREHSVEDYGGSGMGGAVASTSFGGPDPGMPAIVTELEKAIDRLSGATSLVSGDDHTLPLLESLHFDFRSRTAAMALPTLVANCRTTLAREFLRRGASARYRARGMFVSGRAVAFAPFCADIALARALEERGALDDPATARDFYSRSLRSGNPAMVRMALRHVPDVEAILHGEPPPLHAAAGAYVFEKGSPMEASFDPAAVVRLLLRAGARLERRNDEGNTALWEADNAAVMRVLLDAGANPRVRNKEGKTPLFGLYGVTSLWLLVEHGADIHARDHAGRTALFDQTWLDGTRELIRLGADVNAVDTLGDTPLETARQEDVALALLAAGARLPADPRRRAQLLQHARDSNWNELAAALEAAGLATEP